MMWAIGVGGSFAAPLPDPDRFTGGCHIRRPITPEVGERGGRQGPWFERDAGRHQWTPPRTKGHAGVAANELQTHIRH